LDDSLMAPSKKDLCFRDLRNRILQLDLAPGADLDETSFSTHYGLSRTPLREVFQKLAGEGYLSIEPNRGAVVAAMDLYTMRCFFQTAPIIYAAVARLAAEQAIPAQIKALKDAQAHFMSARAASDNAALALWNHRFHEIIGEMATNPYLLPSLRRLLIDHTRMSHIFYRAKTAEDSIRVLRAAQQHDEMIEAFATHNAELAVELTLDHWALSRGEIEKYVWPDPLPETYMQPFSGDSQ
ncbi:MAG: GntR family transcriptional regulator, partial [Paracoccaceae bacterium]